MSMGLQTGPALREANMSNVLVLSVATSSHVTPTNCPARCMAEQTVRASKEKITSVDGQTGSWHWYPNLSDTNHIPNPCADASTWIVNVECPISLSYHTMDLKKNNLLDHLTHSMNHVSSQWTVLFIFIFQHISDFLAVFTYKPPKAGLNHGYMFSTQFSWPAILSHSQSSFAFPQVKLWVASTSLSCFYSLRDVDITLGSTLNPRMGMMLLEICFLSTCGRLISSQSCRTFVWLVGMIFW